MSKRIFANEQINILLQNPNVNKCSKKSISYRKEFKISAVRSYWRGLPPNEIFRQAGFDIGMIGLKTPKECLQRWRKIDKEKGDTGLALDGRGQSKAGGRPKTNWSTEKEKLKYLEAQVAYLQAENAFLAKLRKQRLN